MRETINYYKNLRQASNHSQNREDSLKDWELAKILRKLNSGFMEKPAFETVKDNK